jgi:hypothetical protein
MTILRYEKTINVTSNQDVFGDVVDWLGFLKASEYLIELLIKTHGLTNQQAKQRAKLIIPHIQLAEAFIQQSLDGPAKVAFLPGYYAILNLMKVYVLIGPYHVDLEKNRWHGITYDTNGKDSHSLMTEEITIANKGVFQLFYRTLTGIKLAKGNHKIGLDDFLGMILPVGAEYEIATGHPTEALLPVRISHAPGAAANTFIPHVQVISNKPVQKGQIKLLTRFRPVAGQANSFHGSPFKALPGMTPVQIETEIRKQLRTHLLYRYDTGQALTVVSSKRMQFPEELPIALLFFYMSSVVRYRPVLFDKLQDSKYWALLAASRKHAMLAFIFDFWSFAHKSNTFIG